MALSPTTKKKLLTTARDYVMITFGLACYAFGFTAFVLPEHVVTGGVTGLASLLYFAFGFNVAASYYIINIILLAIAYRTVGRQFVLRTILGATIATLLLGFLQPLFTEPIVKQQPFMNVLIGAVLCGFGVGTVFVHNGSSAGTDIVAAMVTKKSTISFGRVMLYIDMLIIASSYFVFHEIDKVLFGLIFMVIIAYASDMVINTSRQTVQFIIISKKWETIANAINTSAHRGCTLLDGMGWYSKQSVKLLLVLCRRYESVNILRIIKAIDPRAMISQANVSGVYGQGFDEVKVRVPKQGIEGVDVETDSAGDTERTIDGIEAQ